jgi:hypothetical protein
MLDDSLLPPLSSFESWLYDTVVPQDHYLRKAAMVVPWDDFKEVLAPFYCQDVGRPPIPPVVMLKLEFLRFHHNLSDREVITNCGRESSCWNVRFLASFTSRSLDPAGRGRLRNERSR